MKGPFFLLAPLLWPVLLLAAPTPASAPASATLPASPLQRAIEHYQRSEFDRAERLLEKLIADLGEKKSRDAQEAHTYLAFVHVANGRREAALASFERALAIRPSLALPEASPKVGRLFAQAKQRFEAKRRALDHDPPRLAHVAINQASYGDRLVIKAQASDISRVKEVLLNYRVANNRGWTTAKMERGDADEYIATLPPSVVVRPGVEYYVEAWDELGNGPGLKGSSRAPIRVAVEGGPLASQQLAKSSPWYKKWWVWAIAAGVVVATGSTAAAVYFSRDQEGRIDVDWPQAEISP